MSNTKESLFHRNKFTHFISLPNTAKSRVSFEKRDTQRLSWRLHGQTNERTNERRNIPEVGVSTRHGSSIRRTTIIDSFETSSSNYFAPFPHIYTHTRIRGDTRENYF